jgi:hypothetical protein
LVVQQWSTEQSLAAHTPAALMIVTQQPEEHGVWVVAQPVHWNAVGFTP